MRILIYGAGAQGSLLAARLHVAGEQVSLLARGQRLEALRKQGLMVEDLFTHSRHTYPVPIVDQLKPEDEYDWVIVVMGKADLLDILPALAANTRVANFLFLGNNVAGGSELAVRLGRERVAMGFLMAVGKIEGQVALVSNNREGRHPVSILGELDGSTSARLIELAAVLENAGIPIQISDHVEGWLKYHAALILPLAGAYFLADSDLGNMGGTRDIQILLVRGILEALKVLRAYRIPVDPPMFKLFLYLPEPLLVLLAKRILLEPSLEYAMIHAGGMRREFRQLGREFASLACGAGMLTPHLDHLALAARPETNCLPRGSRKLEMDWSSIWLVLSLTLALIGITRRLNRRRARINSRS